MGPVRSKPGIMHPSFPFILQVLEKKPSQTCKIKVIIDDDFAKSPAKRICPVESRGHA
jgi:hypothetical protein